MSDSEFYEGGVAELMKSVTLKLNDEIGRLTRITRADVRTLPEHRPIYDSHGRLVHTEFTGKVRIILEIDGEG